MSIEIREWSDTHWIALGVLDCHAEPKPQLAKPDGSWIDIHSEDRACQHRTSYVVNRAFVAESRAKRRDFFEGMDEKCAGPAGGIENVERVEPTEEVL